MVLVRVNTRCDPDNSIIQCAAMMMLHSALPRWEQTYKQAAVHGQTQFSQAHNNVALLT